MLYTVAWLRLIIDGKAARRDRMALLKAETAARKVEQRSAAAGGASGRKLVARSTLRA
jgi:hypothetical protein